MKKHYRRGISKEEQEKLQREKEEAAAVEALQRREADAEEAHAKETARRDTEEEEERVRQRREEQIRLMASKDLKITQLAGELDSERARFHSERYDLERELERALAAKEELLNEMSLMQSDTEQTQRRLLEERRIVVEDRDTLRSEITSLKSELQHEQRIHSNEKETLQKQLAELKQEAAALREQLEHQERDLTQRMRQMEREVEKTSALNSTLQEIVESREADDRKNVTLMQLLNSQLEDTKRRSHELLDEERQKSVKLKQQVMTLEAKLQQNSEENEVLKRERDLIRKQADAELLDSQVKVEHLRFDMKYLHSELHNYKSQCAKQQQEAAQMKNGAASESQACRLEMDALHKKVEEMEALMRRKDREHFDKVTFLNAQIANNRTIVSQLQQKLQRERDERTTESKNAMVLLESRSSAIQAINDEMERKTTASGETETKLISDISILKTSVFQLQSALNAKERQFDLLSIDKDREICRLQQLLDDHFIPHRSLDAPSVSDVEATLTQELKKLSAELEALRRNSTEEAVRLKAQISNQNLIIDGLERDLARCKTDFQHDLRVLEAENFKLRELLEANFIPYKN